MTQPQRYPTRDELDYQARREAGFPSRGNPANQSKGVVSTLSTQFAVEDNDTSAYIGVTEDRMTYAEELNKPFAAEEGVESDREARLVEQEVLVAPLAPAPEAKPTGGGGSTQESVYTALSGENFSSEIAKEPEVKKVDTPPQGQVERSEPGGSTGQTVSEAEEQRIKEAAEQQGSESPISDATATGSPAPRSAEGDTEEQPTTSTAATPTTPPRKRTSS